MKLHPVQTAAGFGGLLRATSRLGERPLRPPPPRGSSARRHVGSPEIAVLGAAGGYLILPVLLSALGLLRSDVRARERSPGGGGRDGEDRGAVAPPARDTVTCFKKQLLLEAGLEMDRQQGIPLRGARRQLQPVLVPVPGSPAASRGTPAPFSIAQHPQGPCVVSAECWSPACPGALGTAPWPPAPFSRSLSDACVPRGRGDAGGGPPLTSPFCSQRASPRRRMRRWWPAARWCSSARWRTPTTPRCSGPTRPSRPSTSGRNEVRAGSRGRDGDVGQREVVPPG